MYRYLNVNFVPKSVKSSVLPRHERQFAYFSRKSYIFCQKKLQNFAKTVSAKTKRTFRPCLVLPLLLSDLFKHFLDLSLQKFWNVSAENRTRRETESSVASPVRNRLVGVRSRLPGSVLPFSTTPGAPLFHLTKLQLDIFRVVCFSVLIVGISMIIHLVILPRASP